MGSLHGATRFGMDHDIGGLAVAVAPISS